MSDHLVNAQFRIMPILSVEQLSAIEDIKDTITAYHEAGHAWMAHQQKVPIRYFQWHPMPGRSAAIATEVCPYVLSELRITLAGPEAQRLYARSLVTKADTEFDDAMAAEVIERVFGTDNEGCVFLEQIRAEVHRALKSNWLQIEELAQALIYYLDDFGDRRVPGARLEDDIRLILENSQQRGRA